MTADRIDHQICSDLSISNKGTIKTQKKECVDFIYESINIQKKLLGETTLPISYVKKWGSYRIDLLKILPNSLSRQLNKSFEFNGPNCVNTALRFWKISNYQLFDSFDKISSVVSDGSFNASSSPSFGSIGLLLTGDEEDSVFDLEVSELTHAYIYLFNGYVLSKNGLKKDDRLVITTEERLIEYYSPSRAKLYLFKNAQVKKTDVEGAKHHPLININNESKVLLNKLYKRFSTSNYFSLTNNEKRLFLKFSESINEFKEELLSDSFLMTIYLQGSSNLSAILNLFLIHDPENIGSSYSYRTFDPDLNSTYGRWKFFERSLIMNSYED